MRAHHGILPPDRPRAKPLPALAALFLLLASPAVPQQPESGLFFDTVDVEVVNVEVTVTDRQGRPVRGLGRDDFEVYENGERVPITHFVAVEDREVLIGLPPGAEPGSPPAAGAFAPETRQLNLVVVVDDGNLEPKNRNLLFRDLREHVATELNAWDRMMLVKLDSGAVEVVEPFTHDRERLLVAVETMSRRAGNAVGLAAEHRMYLSRLQRASLINQDDAGASNSLAGADPADFEATLFTAERLVQDARNLAEMRAQSVRHTLDTLERFVDSLAGLPGRKAVLYLSDGLPVRAADSLAEAWIGKFEEWVLRNHQQRLLHEINSLQTLQYDTHDEVRELVERASAQGVVFYPVSAFGRGPHAGLSAEFAGDGAPGGRGPMSAAVTAVEASTREASLVDMAAGTGGLALTGTTKVGELLARMSRDFATFYSLGYAPPESAKGSDKPRRIEVKVAGDGLTARHLTRYRKKGPEERLEERTLAALYYDSSDNPLEVVLTPGLAERTGRDRFRVPVMVKIPFSNLLLLPQAASHSARVSLFVVAGDGRGGVSPMQKIELPIEIPNGRLREAAGQLAAYPLELEMRKGRQRLAVGALDQLARIASTVTLELEVGTEGERLPAPR